MDGPITASRSRSKCRGGSYLAHHPEFYRNTSVTNFRAPDEAMRGRDILEMVIPGARERGMKVIPELMEPLFKYSGHGSANTVQIPNLVQLMEVDYLGRISGAPCLENPDYRGWWRALIEDHCRSYDIDGIMWCNERRSPLDQLVTGMAPGCFCKHCLASLDRAGIDPEGARRASAALHDYFRKARAGAHFTDGALITGLRTLLDNPEFLLLERHWVERNKDLDRELYGLVKWCDPALEFGLNVWNRNHFNPVRKAQWPWAETKDYADWVKPITYQHQSGGIYINEMTQLHATPIARSGARGDDAADVSDSGARRGAVGRASRCRHGPGELCWRAVPGDDRSAGRRAAGADGDRGRRAARERGTGGVHAGDRVRECARGVRGGCRRRHLFAQLREHEAHQSRWGRAGARGTRDLTQRIAENDAESREVTRPTRIVTQGDNHHARSTSLEVPACLAEPGPEGTHVGHPAGPGDHRRGRRGDRKRSCDPGRGHDHVGRRGRWAGGNGRAVVDTGGTILAGLINSHAHLAWDGIHDLAAQSLGDAPEISAYKAAENMLACLRAGITLVRDLGMNRSGAFAKQAVEQGVFAGPRLLIVAEAITQTGGHTYWCCREATGPTRCGAPYASRSRTGPTSSRS